VAIVGNPFSGRGANGRRVARLEQTLRAEGLEAAVMWDRREWQARLAAEDWRCVVAAGGDGTVADVINAGVRAPVAALALGNQNLLAKRLGYPRDGEKLARLVALGRTRRIDLGAALGRRFSLMVSVGLDAEVVRRFAAWREKGGALKRSSSWRYAGSALGALRGYAFPRLRLVADGQRVEGAQALVFNAPAYALGLRFAPDGKEDDGLLDWVVLERGGVAAALGFYAAAATGLLPRLKGARWGQAREARIESEAPAPIQMDGEAVGWTPVDISVAAAALEVVRA